MYKYDIPYPKPDQLSLNINGIPINISKRKDYLISKMKAHRREMVLSGADECAKYEILDYHGNIILRKQYKKGEYDQTNSEYHVKKEKKINYIRNGDFNLIADDSGNILTDEKMLMFLYDFRFHNRIPVMITNDALVSRATYKPKTKEEFVSLHGLGQKVYDKCGEMFINAIENFEEKK